jgi:transcriptional regulator with XRE-family HTH domain
MTIGTKLKAWRDSKNKTQQETAEFLGIDRATLSLIETNKRPIKSKELTKVAQMMGMTVDALLHSPDPVSKKIEHSGNFIKDNNGNWWNLLRVECFIVRDTILRGYTKEDNFDLAEFANAEICRQALDALMISIGYSR